MEDHSPILKAGSVFEELKHYSAQCRKCVSPITVFCQLQALEAFRRRDYARHIGLKQLQHRVTR